MLLLSQVHIGMFFHVDRIDVGIKVGVLHGVPARSMPKDMLCNIGTGNFIEISGCGMAQEMRM